MATTDMRLCWESTGKKIERNRHKVEWSRVSFLAGRRRAYINQTLVLVQGVTTLERTKRRKETTERKKQLRKNLRKVRKGSRNTRREIETTFLSFFRFFSLFTNSPARYAKCRLIVTLVGKVCFPRSCYKDVTKDKLSQSRVWRPARRGGRIYATATFGFVC